MTEWKVSQADVIRAAERDQLDVRWLTLLEGVEVMADAARLDGVRVPVTGATAERIAAIWEVELPTPATVDLRHVAAGEWGLRVVPQTFDHTIMQSAEAVRGFSSAIDAQGAPIARTEAPPVLVSDVGKVWCRTADLERRRRSGEQTLACNYGLFTPTAPYDSVLRVGKLWQQPSYRHDTAHWDYSQTLQLVRVAPGGVQPSHDGLTSWRLTLLDPQPPLEPPRSEREFEASISTGDAALAALFGGAMLAALAVPGRAWRALFG